MNKPPIFNVLDSVLEHVEWVEKNDRQRIKFFTTSYLKLSDLGSSAWFTRRVIEYVRFERESADLIDKGNTVIVGAWVDMYYRSPLTEAEFDELVDLLDLE
jgi:uncharacterized OB-fold protein